jgi:hypothetical protein
VGAPGKSAEQGQLRDARGSHAADGRGAEKKKKIASKFFYRIYAFNRDIKSRETEKA